VQRWEYSTTLLEAQAAKAPDYLAARFPGWKPERNSPEALIPALNAWGLEGWELVSIQPVYAGTNSDLLVHEREISRWSSTYLCAFKRLLPEG
jgi:hypothetical protein